MKKEVNNKKLTLQDFLFKPSKKVNKNKGKIKENFKEVVTLPKNKKKKIIEDSININDTSKGIEKVVKSKKNKEDHPKKYGIGLDVGTGFIVGASYGNGTKMRFNSVRDAFMSIDKSKFNPVIFNKNKLSYIDMEDKIVIVGNDAMEFARLFNSSAQRPLSNGVINPKEKSSAPILREIFSNIIKDLVKKEDETLIFSVPGLQIGNNNFNVNFHSMTIEALCKYFNVKAIPINEAYAVAISELGIDQVTALSFSFGAGLVNACLTFKSINVFEFSIDKSGDYIDDRASKDSNESESTVCHIKENELDLSKDPFSVSDVERALIFSYREVIKNTLNEVKKAFLNNNKVKLTDDIPIVLSGGTTKPKGFKELFEEELKNTDLSFKVSKIITAENPLTAVAKGCLIWANSLESIEG